MTQAARTIPVITGNHDIRNHERYTHERHDHNNRHDHAATTFRR